ncbi:MAG: ATP-grasp domain-containing protein, partial [Acetobacteraceae bacterium]
MNLLEYHAKREVLAPAGIAVPEGAWCENAEAAAMAAGRLGPVVVKAQVPAGHRGKTGGVRVATSPEEAERVARDIFGMTFAGHRPRAVLVERRVPIAREFYAAVLAAPGERAPVVMFSSSGGMDIEEIAAREPASIGRQVVRDLDGFDASTAAAMLADSGLGALAPALADALVRLYRRYRETDAELIEINPLAECADHSL